MNSPTTYLIFGSLVSAAGLVLVAFHVRGRYRRNATAVLTEAETRFRDQQYSRRMQTSVLTITLGALIGLFGCLRIIQDSPVFATIYVMTLLFLSAWLVLMAMSDALASRIQANRTFRENHREERSLQQALAEVRQAYGIEQ